MNSDETDDAQAQSNQNALLEQLDEVLEGIKVGMPLFATEARLVERLRTVFPGVRFAAQDIRAWASKIAS